MIKLDAYEKKLILVNMGQLPNKYSLTGKWVNTLKPLYIETYGGNPDEYYEQYLYVMFYKLLEVHLKIKEDLSGCNQQIMDVFAATFGKSLGNDFELPVERAIHTICGLISCTKLIDNEGNKRFELE